MMGLDVIVSLLRPGTLYFDGVYPMFPLKERQTGGHATYMLLVNVRSRFASIQLSSS